MNRKRLALTAAVIGALAGVAAFYESSWRAPTLMCESRYGRLRPVDAIPAAFRLIMTSRIILDFTPVQWGRAGAYDPDYNFYKDIKGTEFESDPVDFFGSHSASTTASIIAQKRQEAQDWQTLACLSPMGDLLASILLGAAAAAALSYFGPRLLARLIAGLAALWLRWLRWVREKS